MEPKELASASVAVTYREENMLLVKHSNVVHSFLNLLSWKGNRLLRKFNSFHVH